MSDTTSTSSTESDSTKKEFDLRVEKTLALIKPEAVKFASDIEKIIKTNGFDIVAERSIHLTPEQAAEFYTEHFGQPYYANLVVHMSDNPIIAMCLTKPNAIAEWLKIVGPTNVVEAQAYWPNSLRACYGKKSQEDGEYNNAIHGSEDHATALREIHFFFPQLVVGPILRGGQINEYLQGNVNNILLKGLEELCKTRPMDPLVWLADWLLIHNPNCAQTVPVEEDTESDVQSNRSLTTSTTS